MDRLTAVRLGGLGNFGGGMSRLRSTAELALEELGPADRAHIEKLFTERCANAGNESGLHRDGFRVRLVLHGANRTREIEVPESALPASLIPLFKDELL